MICVRACALSSIKLENDSSLKKDFTGDSLNAQVLLLSVLFCFRFGSIHLLLAISHYWIKWLNDRHFVLFPNI